MRRAPVYDRPMPRVFALSCCLLVSVASCTDRSRIAAPPAVDAMPSAPAPAASPSSALAQPSSAPASASSAVSPDPCPARGALPPDWFAEAIDPSGSIPIARWRMTVGDDKRFALRDFDDTGWEPLDAPSTRAVESRSKQIVVWLRSAFVVPESADPSKLSIDLGARTGSSVVYLNGKKVGASALRNGPVFLEAPLALDRGTNILAIRLVFGSHVGALRWSGASEAGVASRRARGPLTRTFASRIDGSQQTVSLLVPRCADLDKPLPLVVALPGWDGNIHGFAHSKMMAEADRRGWLVLVPDPRGNLLYTGASEEGVLEAVELVSREAKVDPDRVYLTGVSMGGAGALQIAYHFPDRFAAVAAFYGDSRYDLDSYVRSILRDQKTAERYSVLSFHENARNFPVLLVHARDDKVSPFAQSKMLADADARSGFTHHRLIAPDRGGHSLQVVEDAVAPMMELFASSVRQSAPPRVGFRTSAARYAGAWWLKVSPPREGTFGGADVTIELKAREVRLHAVEAGTGAARVDLGAAGLRGSEPIAVTVERAVSHVAFVLPGGWEAAVLRGPGAEQRARVSDGQVRFGALAAGRWMLAPGS